MDPFGNVPFFITTLNRVPEPRRLRVTVRELLIAYGLMVLFLFLGKPFLQILGISEPALSIAGGVILFLIALRMVFPATHTDIQESIDGEPFIVPLAIPYVAGPSVLAAELLLMSRDPSLWPQWLLAISIAWAVTAVIIMLGSHVANRLGSRGLIAMERLMGMVLVAIAIELFLSGTQVFILSLP